MKQVLIETTLFKVNPTQLTEGVKSSAGNPIVEGVLTTAGVKNGNSRYYDPKIWKREIEKYQTIVKENRATGELDHPDSSIINLKNVSHIIREIWWNGDHVMGKIEILPTAAGNILKALIENGVVCGVSSRGEGSLQPMSDGMMEVQDDFNLICWDFVSTPSNPGSYMHLVREGMESQQVNPYNKVNKILTEILCSNGTCPII
jgi:hypothetical protein